MDAGVKSEACTHRFQGLINFVKCACLCTPHQRDRRIFCKSQLLIRIEQRARLEISGDDHRRTVEVRARKHSNPVWQYLTRNIVWSWEGVDSIYHYTFPSSGTYVPTTRLCGLRYSFATRRISFAVTV